jgi:hypothetical protein|nr:MAG TPA: hypothetical protein [Caudoviricetes sp.]
MNQKRRSMIAVILIAIIVICIIGIMSKKPAGDDKPATDKKETVESLTLSNNSEKETETTGKSATIDGVDVIFSDNVKNDATGNARLAKVTGEKSVEEYVLDYYKMYFKSDQEVHAIVNYTLNTTACVTSVGDKINVRIYEHIDGEEQDAKKLFTGEKYAEYNVDKETGAIDKVE